MTSPAQLVISVGLTEAVTGCALVAQHRASAKDFGRNSPPPFETDINDLVRFK